MPTYDLGGATGELMWRLGSELDPLVHARRMQRVLVRTSVERQLRDAVHERCVLVTGASTGIGRAVAIRLAAAGATVLLVARNRERLQAVAEQIAAGGGTSVVYPCDLGDQAAVRTLVATILERHEKVDILINNAGRSIRRPLSESTDRLHDYERVMRVNYFGMVWLTLPLVERMRETGGGQVINVSTLATLTGTQPLFSAYLASKGAMDLFTRAAAPETAADGVRWTTVHMPLVRTEMIAPTSAYRRAPAMSAAAGADMVLDAVVRVPVRVTHPLGSVLRFVDSVAPKATQWLAAQGQQPTPRRELPSVAIVGGGVSGMAMAMALRAAGAEDFTLFEKGSSVGGTWRENTYPGLACDVPAHYYAFEREPNPRWSRVFAPGPEIQAYLEGVADQRELRRHIQFDTEIASARFDEPEHRWHLRSTAGEEHTADVLVCATGVLHQPRIPEIPGLAEFAGPMFHSARWDHTVALEGTHVGVVGTGSTGVQLTTALAARGCQVTLFQRTPQWVATVPNPPIPAVVQHALAHVPGAGRATYAGLRTCFDLLAHATIRPGWQRELLGAVARRSLEAVTDADLRERLRPADAPLCKRLVFSPGFYDAVQRDGVTVADSPISRVTADGVATADGREHELDVLVLATGFDAQAFMRPMELIGRDGLTISRAWADGPRAHQTTAIPGFPNLFMLMGPNSPIGNSSLVPVAETQAAYVTAWLERMRDRDLAQVEPRESAAARFEARVAAAMPDTVWTSGCASWYLREDGIPMLWPWSMGAFRDMLAAPAVGDFIEIRAGSKKAAAEPIGCSGGARATAGAGRGGAG